MSSNACSSSASSWGSISTASAWYCAAGSPHCTAVCSTCAACPVSPICIDAGSPHACFTAVCPGSAPNWAWTPWAALRSEKGALTGCPRGRTATASPAAAATLAPPAIVCSCVKMRIPPPTATAPPTAPPTMTATVGPAAGGGGMGVVSGGALVLVWSTPPPATLVEGKGVVSGGVVGSAVVGSAVVGAEVVEVDVVGSGTISSQNGPTLNSKPSRHRHAQLSLL
mmetsp:Transcript_39657/g.93309  ORF Transcript_39657/g.93309 Transcript_39657/m.93309 type:complete len:225 (-) Transcript_39657:809-1483(-)